MDSIKRLNEALDYIETHLKDDISINKLAEIAYTSAYHFQRMFSFLAGLPLGEYVKRRKLTVAAEQLQRADEKVIEVALDFGYGSPDAFTKAFVQWHGVTPSAVKKGAAIRCQTKLTFQIQMRGGQTMNYKLIKQDAFYFTGIYSRVSIQFEGINPEVAALYQRLNLELIGHLKAQSDMAPRGIVSASLNFSEDRMQEAGQLDQWVGVCTTQKPQPNEDYFEVEAGDWAVFQVVGPFPQTLQAVWGQIFAEWFPSSDYELRTGPEMLWHEGPDTSLPEFKSEIWIPVKRRQ